MIHEVRVFDAKGKLKKVIPKKKARKEFWKRFAEGSDFYSTAQQGYYNKHGSDPVLGEGEESLYE